MTTTTINPESVFDGVAKSKILNSVEMRFDQDGGGVVLVRIFKATDETFYLFGYDDPKKLNEPKFWVDVKALGGDGYFKLSTKVDDKDCFDLSIQYLDDKRLVRRSLTFVGGEDVRSNLLLVLSNAKAKINFFQTPKKTKK